MSKGFVPKSKLLKRDALTGFLFSLPSIIGMLVFFLIPFVICIILSLTDSISSMKFVGIDNYVDIISSRTFRLAVWNTFKFIIVAVPLIMIFSLTIAMLLYQKFAGFEFFRRHQSCRGSNRSAVYAGLRCRRCAAVHPGTQIDSRIVLPVGICGQWICKRFFVVIRITG